MDTIVKSFSGIFFLMFILAAGTGIITSSVDAGRAERFASDCAVRISNSNYEETVISECTLAAKQKGYRMEVDLQGRGKRPEYGSLKLYYPYKIAMIALDEEHCIQTDIY